MKLYYIGISVFCISLLAALFSSIPLGAQESKVITLTEGDLISSYAYDGDPDIFIINEHGYKRLFLNPAIFSFYGHLRYRDVIAVPPSVKNEFQTSGFYRNCEDNDTKVYALETTDEDEGELTHIDITGEEALTQDVDFPQKVFCINKREFNWYRKRAQRYNALSRVVPYVRPHYPLIKVENPNGSEVWEKGSSQVIQWSIPLSVRNATSTDSGERSNIASVDITLIGWKEPCRVAPCVLPRPHVLRQLAVYPIALHEPNNGNFTWVVGGNLRNEAVPEGRYVIQVCRAGTRACDISDAPFSIAGDGGESTLVVVSPNGGEIWERGTEKEIQWKGVTSAVDVQLLRWQGPCVSPVCSLIVRPEVKYTLVRNSSSAPFLWRVGEDEGGKAIPNGRYVVRVVSQGGDVDQSDAPFSIVRSSQGNLPPVINGISGPRTLVLGEEGTWRVRAQDHEEEVLTYSVVWGDEGSVREKGYAATPAAGTIQQVATFTHAYAKEGMYWPLFIVTDGEGLEAKSQISVFVQPPSVEPLAVQVLSPNGGENWYRGLTYPIRWSRSGVTSVDVGLYKENAAQPGLYDPATNPDGTVYIIASNYDGDSLDWTIPEFLPLGKYKLSVSSMGSTSASSILDYSDASFTLSLWRNAP